MRAIITFLTLAVLMVSPNICAAKAITPVPAACHLTKTPSSAPGHACCGQAVPSTAMTCCPLAAEILKQEKILFEQFQLLHSELIPIQILTQISEEKNIFSTETPPLFTSRIFAKTYSSNSPPQFLNFAF